MFYVKNVPGWERVLRVIVGLAVVAWSLLALGGTWGAIIALSAAGIVASGLFGFCPACALVGRRLDKARKANGAL
ncbi:YgaP family membrane protein [Pseudoduganella sp. RAF53_2]|uniref:YgaP family membrane protein n=1 Tax=unclassified Pseudoduganella TaxID=2637179 RepID=UPI003F98E0F1